jgi:hypothetical protein
MITKHRWSADLICEDQGDLKGVIVRASWRLSSIIPPEGWEEGQEFESPPVENSLYGVAVLPPPDPENFVDAESITPDQVKAWASLTEGAPEEGLRGSERGDPGHQADRAGAARRLG